MGNRLVVAKGEGAREMDGMGVQGQQMQTITVRMDKQRGPTVQHRELYPVTWDRTSWKIIGEEEYIYICLGHFAEKQKLTQHCKSTIIFKKRKKKKEVLEMDGDDGCKSL